MRQIEKSNSNMEITVNSANGEAYISQRKAAELLGVSQQAIQQRCLSQKFDVKEGLSSEIFSLLVTHYALDSRNTTDKAKELLRQITQAGAKAYLYHLAGYTMSAKPAEETIITLSGYLDYPTIVVKRELELHGLFGTPLHLAQIESVKTTESITGVDLSRFLLNAPAQSGIVNEDIMLEPKEIADRLGFKSAIALNKKLIELGLQSRINGELVATDEALGMYSKHAWKSRSKSGYNYKWNLAAIRAKLLL